MRAELHPRVFQVLDLSRRGMKGRMVAAIVGISRFEVLWIRLTLPIRLWWVGLP